MSGASHRISAADDLADQARNSLVQRLVIGTLRDVFMSRRGISKDVQDLGLWNDVEIIQGQKQELDDCQCGGSRNVLRVSHFGSTFQREKGRWF